MVIPVTELGCIGHFILADKCRFRRHTQVGTKYRVSSVGDMFFELINGQGERRQTVGAGDEDFYETMVFETDGTLAAASSGCGCMRVVNIGEELECQRYATAGEANVGHDALVAKYRKLAAGIMR